MTASAKANYNWTRRLVQLSQMIKDRQLKLKLCRYAGRAQSLRIELLNIHEAQREAAAHIIAEGA